MSTRSRGKRLATGITVAVGAGSVAVAGVSAAAVYAATPSVIARTTPTTDSSTHGTTPKSGGSTSSGTDGYGSGQEGTRRSKSYSSNGSTSPVQPGNGGTVHGRSSGS